MPKSNYTYPDTRYTNRSVLSKAENTYKYWAQKNIVPFSLIAAFILAYFTIIIVIMADAHWACATKANPMYINFNQLTWMGLWYRCINFYQVQDQSASGTGSQTWNCLPMDPTIQILPALYIYSRIIMCIAIMLSFSSLLLSILIFPLVNYSYHNKRKMTLVTAVFSLTTSLLVLSVTVWWVAASYNNGLGWVSGALKPVQFVQPYVSAWKPAWCCWLGFFSSCLAFGFSLFIFYTYKNMPDFDFEGIIEKKIEMEEQEEEFQGRNESINDRFEAERVPLGRRASYIVPEESAFPGKFKMAVKKAEMEAYDPYEGFKKNDGYI